MRKPAEGYQRCLTERDGGKFLNWHLTKTHCCSFEALTHSFRTFLWHVLLIHRRVFTTFTRKLAIPTSNKRSNWLKQCVFTRNTPINANGHREKNKYDQDSTELRPYFTRAFANGNSHHPQVFTLISYLIIFTFLIKRNVEVRERRKAAKGEKRGR